jgi:hypothetical protein
MSKTFISLHPTTTRKKPIMSVISHIEQSLIKSINQNFVIRYRFDGDKKTSLIGAGKYAILLENSKDPIDLALRHFDRALNSDLTKTVIRLRGGLTVNFCLK